MTWMWFGGTRSLSSEPPALGGRKGSDQAWCCFMKKYRDCSKVTTAKCSTHLPWSQLFIHSDRQERSKGRFKPARREAEGKSWLWTEASPEESRNTHPLMLQLRARHRQTASKSTCYLGTSPTLSWNLPAMAE